MAFKAQMKVCFGDIDNAGIVYYPRFLHYFHLAKEEFFSGEFNLDYATIVGKYRLGFPTVHLEADFKQRLRYGDCLEVEVRILRLGETSVTWGYTVRKIQEDDIVAQGHSVAVFVNLDSFEKQRLPGWLRTLFEQYQQKCLLLEEITNNAGESG